MTGLELARAYYEEFGAPMIHNIFPGYESRIACGLAGSGSECFGFDDEKSQDHDFGSGFCLWLTDEDYEKIGDDLTAEYQNLPNTFKGFPAKEMILSGEHRVGPMRISDYYSKFTGTLGVPQTLEQWRRIPENFLATAVNGEVFRDDLGEYTAFREALLAFYPEDIRLKKMVARIAVMAQAGQYNYPRCVQRGEWVAAMCAVGEFVEATCSMVYLLNKKYAPFYKWAHRGMKYLSVLPGVYDLLSLLCAEGTDAKRREDLIEEICVSVGDELRRQGLSETEDDFLLEHCGDLMNKISDPGIRQLHIMAE